MFHTKFVEKIKPHINVQHHNVFRENRAVYGIMWENATDDNIRWCMRFAHRITRNI